MIVLDTDLKVKEDLHELYKYFDLMTRFVFTFKISCKLILQIGADEYLRQLDGNWGEKMRPTKSMKIELLRIWLP